MAHCSFDDHCHNRESANSVSSVTTYAAPSLEYDYPQYLQSLQPTTSEVAQPDHGAAVNRDRSFESTAATGPLDPIRSKQA